MSSKQITRRAFLKTAGLSTTAMFLSGCLQGSGSQTARAFKEHDFGTPPPYLAGYGKVYRTNPRRAAIEWFVDAKFGLFMHYGLYSILGRGEWVQFREIITVAEYAKFKDRFTAENFDADYITDLALKAEMKYINITTRHHDSFCLFNSKYTDFNSVNSPAGRDLIEELAEQCYRKKLGLFFYYSHGRDWRHPHAPNNDRFPRGSARPKYSTPEPHYKYGREHNLQKYLDFMRGQITELLTNYGPVAGIWLDGVAVPKNNDIAVFKCQELYDYIHSLQPQVLVSYKQGLLGTEDFFTPERKNRGVQNRAGKPLEINTTLQPKIWGYQKNDDSNHLSPEQVMELLQQAADARANLLINTGPLSDGSIHPEDSKTLLEVGKILREQGFPKII
jgi:alpha-L-fucosidase